MTGAALLAKDPAQAGSTQLEAPKPANIQAAGSVSTDAQDGQDIRGGSDADAASDDTVARGATRATAHPKPAKRLNARERQMAKKSGGGNDGSSTPDTRKPMTAKSGDDDRATGKAGDKASDKASDKAEKAKEKAKVKAAQKAQKADTKARKVSAAKAAKAARG